jgi:DHA2 family multidrug resistance protein
MTRMTPEMDSSLVLSSGFIQGVGVGFIFVPLSAVAFATLPAHLRHEGTPVFSLLRNIGSSVGISIVQMLLTEGTIRAHADLAATLVPGNQGLVDLASGAMNGATASGLALLNAEVTRQSALIGYVNDFGIMVALTLAAIPLLLLIRKPRRNEAAGEAAEVPH